LSSSAFCADKDLRYAASRHRFVPDQGFALGEDYRLAHLPLIDPAHPRNIASVPGKDYVLGRYAVPRYALAAHVATEILDASPAFRALNAALKASPAGAKIAWATGEKRRDVLHATIAGPVDAATADSYFDAARDWQARTGGAAARLGGPFVGDRNHGRIYLPVYPEARGGIDMFADLQRAVGARVSGFYAIGVWHFADDLDAREAAHLSAWLDEWGSAEVAIVARAKLGILATTDDQAIHAPAWRWLAAG
jgi:hypothetical protein